MDNVSLYLKTDNSLLESLIKIDDLILYAKKHNLKYLAIADNTMYGVMEFYNKCLINNIKPIIGYELLIENKIIVLYAKNNNGYKNLIKISSLENKTVDTIKAYANDLICIIPFESKDIYDYLKNIYNDLYIGYTNKAQQKLIEGPSIYFKKTLYLREEDSQYYKYLYAINKGITIDKVSEIFENNIDLENELYNENNKNILLKINLEIKKDHNLIPDFECPNGYDSNSYLKFLCKEGIKNIFGSRVSKVYAERLKYEVDTIIQMGYANYFLIVSDYIKYAKGQGILVGPGRGSAAGSLVAYTLGITEVDPIKYNLLFERFLNKERMTLPDIDVDFEDTRRDEVISYCINMYGVKKVVGIITFGTLASKQVIRDLGKVVNIDNSKIDKLSKMLDSKASIQNNFNNNNKLQDYLKQDKELSIIYKVASKLEGIKRHTSLHAAGIVMCKYDLDEVIPIVKNHEGYYTTAYSMDYLEELGLLKMDFLGLKNLTLLNDIIKELNKNNVKIDLETIPMDDSKTYEIFKNANTLGIFQFESDGMKKFLKSFKPSNFEDISAAIALFRPGPMNNIDSYIRRKNHEEEINYFDESLKSILENTYGVIVYQEQIIQIANVMAGYSLGEADILRRAMSKKKSDVLTKEKSKFVKRSIENGYKKELSEEVYELIYKFADYGFNRAHSVAYSLISYKMAYLKANYPNYFFKSLLSSSISSETKTKEYLYEAKINNINILKPDINLSSNDYHIEEFGLRYPLNGIKNLGFASVNAILEERKKSKFKDIFDFVRRTYGKNMNKKTLESLIDASVFNSFGLNNQTLQDNLDVIINYAEIASLDTLKPTLTIKKEYDQKHILKKELEVFGFYLTSHPIIDYKLKYSNIISLNNIENYFNKDIETLVMVESIKEINTKKNETMLFILGSDEFSNIDLVLFPKTYSKYNNIEKSDILFVKAKVEKRFDKYQLVVNELVKVN